MSKRKIVWIVVGVVLGIVLLAGIVLAVLVLADVIVSKDLVLLKSIDGFEKIATLPVSCDVEFDYEYIGEFSITDAEDIEQLHFLLGDRLYRRVSSVGTPPPGFNGATLKLHYADGSSIVMDSYYITDANGKLWIISDAGEFQHFLSQLGKEQGALVER
jgi:hypothetical protein